MEDMFKNEIFGTLEPPHGAIIKAGTSLPTNQDIYFASKWNELFERYSTARIFLRKTQEEDWDYWFNRIDKPDVQRAVELIFKSNLYETALLNYNILVDLSWTITYVSAEYVLYSFDNMMLQAQVTEEQLKERQEIKTETGVVLSWKYLCWVREHPVKSICKETNILYGTQDEMIPYKIVKKFSEENNCRLNFVENGQHWLHTDREVAAMRKWEQTVLKESRSIIPNK